MDLGARGDSKSWRRASRRAITLLTVDGEAGRCAAIVPSSPAIGIIRRSRVYGDTDRCRIVPSPIVISYSHFALAPSLRNLGRVLEASCSEAGIPGSVKVRDLALAFPDEELWRELSSLKERWLGVADLCLELGVPGVR